MKKITGLLLLTLLKGLSSLPMAILYGFSHFIYFLMAVFPGYRKDVVRKNLKSSFPSFSTEELKRTEKRFYKHFSQSIVESIKTFSISEEEINRRVKYINPEFCQEYVDKKQSVLMVVGHFVGWEISGIAISLQGFEKFWALYKPLKNKMVDKFIYNSRAKFNLGLIPAKEAKEIIPEEMEKRDFNCFIFVADQTPKSGSGLWLDFLNQKTSFFRGPAAFAKKLDLPIIYGHIRRTQKGHYTVEFDKVCDNPQDYSMEELTKMHVKLLEQDILDTPDNWLWTHKRWKHKFRPEHSAD